MTELLFHVYRITNIVNCKVYIGWTGPTAGSGERRFRSHINAARRGEELALSRGIRKHGEDKFFLRIIKSFSSRQEALDEEIVQIRLHVSNHPYFGYNMTPGGEGSSSEYWTEDNRCRQSKTLKAFYDAPENSGKASEVRNRPETREALSRGIQEKWKDPDYRRKQKERYERNRKIIPELTPEEKAEKHRKAVEARTAGLRESLKRPEVQQIRLEANRRATSVPMNTLPRRVGSFVRWEKELGHGTISQLHRDHFIASLPEEEQEVAEGILEQYDRTGLVRKVKK